ncbi:zinc-dependent alcohol dehydrogenase family protein [Paraburkholderia bannensis]|uniref:zinc-dependent alcohol dehydrogenase family protein n=1 Tax=Paraburkholderia bannensis TaxID=765414 RepID=UPI0004889292|nr:zinc-dependent alcohol dehydrogenase family protein [Paraburkholderia bannensis]
MKQIRFETFGVPAAVARCVEVADPGRPSPWEVLVDIEACAINPADLAQMSAKYGVLPELPGTIGLDAVGRVVECGNAVHDIEPGDRVLLVGNENGCQRRRVGLAQVFKVAPHLDVLQLAALKVAACTALELVRRERALAAGDWLVQTAPLSSVGRAVLQIARRDGLRTLNVVRRPEAIDPVREAGADAVIVDCEDAAELARRAREATGGASIALGLDGVGGQECGRLAALLKAGGTLVNYGMLSGQPLQIACDLTIFRDITVKGFWLTGRLGKMLQAQRHALIAEAIALLEEGVFNCPVAATYRLDQIGDALRHAMTPSRKGKVFLLPNGAIESAMALS